MISDVTKSYWDYVLQMVKIKDFKNVLVMDREAWHAEVCGIAKCWTWLSNWTEECFIINFVINKTRRNN